MFRSPQFGAGPGITAEGFLTEQGAISRNEQISSPRDGSYPATVRQRAMAYRLRSMTKAEAELHQLAEDAQASVNGSAMLDPLEAADPALVRSLQRSLTRASEILLVAITKVQRDPDSATAPGRASARAYIDHVERLLRSARPRMTNREARGQVDRALRSIATSRSRPASPSSMTSSMRRRIRWLSTANLYIRAARAALRP